MQDYLTVMELAAKQGDVDYLTDLRDQGIDVTVLGHGFLVRLLADGQWQAVRGVEAEGAQWFALDVTGSSAKAVVQALRELID